MITTLGGEKIDTITDKTMEETIKSETPTNRPKTGPKRTRRGRKGRCVSKLRANLRPYSPNAPKNFTQFIMDDHENSNLYLSFEEEWNSNRNTGLKTSTPGTTVVRDSEEYHSPSDESDSFEFMEQDFE